MDPDAATSAGSRTKTRRRFRLATQEAGQYQYEWNTGNLSPGMHYVTLLLDGEPIVKRAVKL